MVRPYALQVVARVRGIRPESLVELVPEMVLEQTVHQKTRSTAQACCGYEGETTVVAPRLVLLVVSVLRDMSDVVAEEVPAAHREPLALAFWGIDPCSEIESSSEGLWTDLGERAA